MAGHIQWNRGRPEPQIAAWGTRRIAPTRPHAVVARRPPGNALAALPLTLTDRTRDTLDLVAQHSQRLRAPATAASGALARLAGRIEQLPPLRVGEDPSTHRSRGTFGASRAAGAGGRA